MFVEHTCIDFGMKDRKVSTKLAISYMLTHLKSYYAVLKLASLFNAFHV